MHCPNCSSAEMRPRRRLGFTMNVCPQCSGVWLSRKDLERLSDGTGLFLKTRGRTRLDPVALPGLKQPLWKELFDAEAG